MSDDDPKDGWADGVLQRPGTRRRRRDRQMSRNNLLGALAHARDRHREAETEAWKQLHRGWEWQSKASPEELALHERMFRFLPAPQYVDPEGPDAEAWVAARSEVRYWAKQIERYERQLEEVLR